MKTGLKFRLDKIENLDYLKNPQGLINSEFPIELFDETDLSGEQILLTVKMIVSVLYTNVLNSKPIDINKYLFNQYSKLDFINQDFFDLSASVFDYLKQFDIGDLNFNDNGGLIGKAISSTIDAAKVLTINRNPIIKAFLNEDQKTDFNELTNKTVKNVKSLDRKRFNNSSKNENFNMQSMMQYLMLSNMMKQKNVEVSESSSNPMNPMLLLMLSKQMNGDSKINPMLLMTMMNKDSSNSGNMNKMIMMSQLMNKGSSNNGNMQQMMEMMSLMDDPEAMKKKMIQNMMMEQFKKNWMKQQQKKMEEKLSSNANPWMDMFNSNQSDDGTDRLSKNKGNPNFADIYSQSIAEDENENMPQMEDIYNNPDTNVNEVNEDPQLERLRQAALKSDTGNKLFQTLVENAEKQGPIPVELTAETDDSTNDPEFMKWMNNEDEDEDDHQETGMTSLDPEHPFYDDLSDGEEGAVIFTDDFDEQDLQMFEMFSTDEEDENVVTRNVVLEPQEPINTEEQWIKEMIDDQELVIKKYFNGVIPEGTRKLDIDGVSYYAFPPKALFSGSYKTTDTLKHYFSKGERPPAEAAALPLTIKGKNEVVSILTSEGVRGDIILPVVGEEDDVKIKNHIPPKAIVEWHKLRKKEIVDESGSPIKDGLVVMDNELVGTVNSASITANCYAISTEETDIGNTGNRPLEYQLNDPTGFYVDNLKETLDLVGKGSDYKNVKEFIDFINASDDLHPGVRAYIDRRGTKVVNDYLHFSMGIDVTIDSFIDDYEELIDYVGTSDSIPYSEFLEDYQSVLIHSICNAISGKDVDCLDIVEGTIEKVERVGDEEVITEVEFDGNDLNENLVVFDNKSQVTEVPWSFDEAGLTLVKQFQSVEPFVVLNRNDDSGDIYEAVEGVYNRAKVDNEDRTVKLITKDLISLEIVKSAYDDDTFIIINR